MSEPEKCSTKKFCEKCEGKWEPPDSPDCRGVRICCDGRCIDDWKMTRDAIQQENALINQRVNWLPFAQALFFAAFVYFANEARPLFLDLLGPKPDGLGRELRDCLWPHDRRMELYGLIGLGLVALFGGLYSFILFISVGAAGQHIRHLENWWNRRYNLREYNPSEEAPEDTLWNHLCSPLPSKDTVKRQIVARERLPCPPINGMLVGEGYRICHAQAVPLTFFCFWVDIIVIALLMIVPCFREEARNPWYLGVVSISVLVISVGLFWVWKRYQLRIGAGKFSNSQDKKCIDSQEDLLMRCRISTDQRSVR
jgi:hypothetical protein